MAKFFYKVAQMPSASATDTSWLNAYGSGSLSGSNLSGSWQLVQVIPLSPIMPGPDGVARGNILCYFVSSST